jgi:hypothetical protein
MLWCLSQLPKRRLCHQTHGFPPPRKDALRKLVGALGKIVRRPIDGFRRLSNLSRSAFGLVAHCRAALLPSAWVEEEHQTAAQTDSRESRD